MSTQLPSPSRGAVIDAAFAEAFAADWIAAWNSHDLFRIFEHYADDFEMFSPIIVERMSQPGGVLRGKARISEYWGRGIASATPPLRVGLRNVFVGVGSVTIVYDSVGRGLAAEVFEFDAARRVIRGRAHYDPVV